MHTPTAALPGAPNLYLDPAAQTVAAQVYGVRPQPYRAPASYVEAFIAPTLLNSWVNFDPANYSPAGYYKDHTGTVHLRGLIKSGVIGSTAFVLPVGYRPAFALSIATASNSLFAICSIDASGNVTPGTGSNVWFSFDNISFRAVQS